MVHENAASLLRKVGRLQRLGVFEAAARLGSFTAAGKELGMTQPAVTRHIRALENSVGTALFDRSANRVSVNSSGTVLLEAIQKGFALVDAGLNQVQPNERQRFVLAANPGIAQRWLMPRLASLQNVVADRDFHLWLFDRDSDLAEGGFDMAVHLGQRAPSDLQTAELFPEIGVPVASPDYAAANGLSVNSHASELRDARLLYLDSRDRSWMNWQGWFDANRVDGPIAKPTVTYSNYALVLQDAVAGAGVALGWRYLVDDLVEEGQLVPVGPETPRPSSNYCLLWPETTEPTVVERVTEWFVDSIGE